MQGIHYILGAHCIGLLTLSLAIGFGTHIYAGKLTTITLGATASRGGQQHSTAVHKIFHTPSYYSDKVTTMSEHMPASDQLQVFAQPGFDITETYAILCTTFNKKQWAGQVPDHEICGTKSIVSNNGLAEEEVTELDVEEIDQAGDCIVDLSLNETEAKFMILKSPATSSHGRMCAIWTSNAAYEAISQRFADLLDHLKCFITPNAPLGEVSRNLLCSLLGNIIVIIVAWSHSLALPQPVSMVHAPRLIIYALLDAWRILILYALKVAVESIPIVQRYLQKWENDLFAATNVAELSTAAMVKSNLPASAASHLGRMWRIHILPRLNGYGGSGKFDASDHIVLYAMLNLIVITELVCMVTYRRQGKKAIDSPFTMRVRGLVAMSSINIGVLILILYNTFLTSLYFHTPLEVWIGLCIAGFGIYLPFWLALIFLDSLNFYF